MSENIEPIDEDDLTDEERDGNIRIAVLSNMDGHKLVMTQERKLSGGYRRYTIDMTLPQARAVIDMLERRIEQAEAL